MKKILNSTWFCLSVLAFLLACNNEADPSTEKERAAAAREWTKRQQETANEWTIVMRENCEYWVYKCSSPGSYSYVYSMTHKGNCINPSHYGKEN